MTALAIAYIGPVLGYFDQRSELHREQARLEMLETEKRSILSQIAAADTVEVLEIRARQQGLVRPGERAFAIRGELEPEPAAEPEPEGDDGGWPILGWFPDLL
ncbi:MAG: septum formation initiator family protein [Miltoncostaeaceae bacterium]